MDTEVTKTLYWIQLSRRLEDFLFLTGDFTSIRLYAAEPDIPRIEHMI